MRTFSAVGLGVAFGASLLMPLTTFAYLTPDQVFGGSSTITAPPAPPTQREGEAVVERQQQQAAERREAVQYQQLVNTTADPVDTYVPPQTASSKGLFDQNAQYELRQDRIADEKASTPTIIIGDSVLHSGAPRVSDTGPATVLGGIAMMLAAVSTFAVAQIRSRKLLALV